MQTKKILELAQSIAKEAGDTALQMQRSRLLEVSLKTDSSFVTSADIAADKLIRGGIESSFPTHKILSEESASTIASMPSDPLWIIDPIDGTTNFSRGIAYWAVSVAVAWDGFVQIGVIYAPQLSECYTAVRGEGATINGAAIPKLIPLAGTSERKSMVATGFHPSESQYLPSLLKQFQRVMEGAHDIRRMGAATLDCTAVACGRLDAYYESVHPWDIAAGNLIARECGAKTGHYVGLPGTGKRDQHLIEDLQAENNLVANPGTFERVQKILSQS